jgi:hypothetical protein
MAVLAISLVLIQKSVTSTAQITSYPYRISGWAWNPQHDNDPTTPNPIGAGWLSLNCYNDFDTPGEYSQCLGIDYGLEVQANTGNITGCAWSGSNLSASGSPLGWVCFDDPFGIQRGGNLYSVATSTDYLNALNPNTFASILNQEDWRCTGTVDRDGLSCAPNGIFCVENGGDCTFTDTDNEAWKLGFPIEKSASADPDFPTSAKPIEGCFNCYEQYNYGCSITNNDCTVATAATDCPDRFVGDPPVLVSQTCSVVKSIDKKCDNCLEYFYYPGRCEDGGGNVNAAMDCEDFTLSQDDCCINNDDCNTGETCQNISSCVIPVGQNIEEYDCTNVGSLGWNTCNTFGTCFEHEVGSFRKVLGAYECSDCSFEDKNNRCILNVDNKNLNSCEACASTWYYPGVMLDHNNYNQANVPDAEFKAYMCGWGWNAWDDGNTRCSISLTTPCVNPVTDCALGISEVCEPDILGLGWFQFSSRIVTTTQPYLSVDSGNIYSQKSISGRYLPPFGHYNASYLIESGGSITNFISSSTLAGDYQGEFSYRPIIDFPSLSTGRYSNALGTIDYQGLIEDFSGNGSNINKYGSTIVSGAPANYDALFMDPLGGAVVKGAQAILNSYIIEIGTALRPKASGVIVVEGDLIINNNITYQTGVPYANLVNIPSVVWIIKGDLLIDAAVTDLAGTFIVLGNGLSPSCAFTPPELPPAGCGQINTCAGGNCAANSLTITGNVIAKYFALNRTYANSTTKLPAETFINDGRLQVNPPPGFEDFSRLMPRFTDN